MIKRGNASYKRGKKSCAGKIKIKVLGNKTKPSRTKTSERKQ